MSLTECSVRPNYSPQDPIKYNKGQLDKTPSKTPISATISLDWLEFFGSAQIPVAQEGIDSFKLSESINILYRGHGTKMYDAFFEVYWEGEKFASLQAHPRWLKGKIEANSIQLKIENSFLYTNSWLEGIQELLNCGFEINNVTRCDLAIDGVDIMEFCDSFFKQDSRSSAYKMKGKADFAPTSYDKKKMMFKSFRVGKSASEKQISIYNKTEEIADNSNKKYIKDFWKNSGLDTSKDIFRVEMRFRSKSVSKFKDFHYVKLTDVNYLASMFKTGASNFFEFVHDTGDKNKSREELVQLIPYDELGANLLEKERKEETTDEYKAKLAIHLFYKILMYQDLKGWEAKNYYYMIEDLVDMYGLEFWYEKKEEIWEKEYRDLSEAKRKAKARRMFNKH